MDPDTERDNTLDPSVEDRIGSADQPDLRGRGSVTIFAGNETNQTFEIEFGAADLAGMTNVENSSDLRIIMDAVDANLMLPRYA